MSLSVEVEHQNDLQKQKPGKSVGLVTFSGVKWRGKEGGQVSQKGTVGRWSCKRDDVNHWGKRLIGQGTPPFGGLY